jgi:hypothetical protein
LTGFWQPCILFLKGTTIKVPIGGSVSKPKVNQTAFQDATGDLMQQVMQKNKVTEKFDVCGN